MPDQIDFHYNSSKYLLNPLPDTADNPYHLLRLSSQKAAHSSNCLPVFTLKSLHRNQAVTYFIDDATQFSQDEVRILHGTGTGALRQAIRQYLDTVPSVASYRDEHVQFGGAGITVVSLR